MTYLLLQTFLLLLASYFLGAFVACMVKRAFFASAAEEAVDVLVPVQADVYAPPVVVPPQPVRVRPAPAFQTVAPRAIDPVQPKIEVLRRPEPRPAPAVLDPSRFERALLGAHPNEGVPRISIIEVRPSVLEPVTGIYQPMPPAQPEPPPALPVEEVASSEPEIVAEEELPYVAPEEAIVETPEQPEPSEPPEPRTGGLAARLRDATTAAAAGAVAAAKAAAAASVSFPMMGGSRRSTVEERAEERDRAAPEAAAEPIEADSVGNSADSNEPSEEHSEATVFEAAAHDPVETTTEREAQPEPEMVTEPEPEPEATPDPEPEPEPEPVSEPEQAPEPQPEVKVEAAPVLPAMLLEGGDDFQRIRAIDSAIEQQLKARGIIYFEHIAGWGASDVRRIAQELEIPGRIEREQWIEQAQILAKGGETYYSRNRKAMLKANAETAAPTPTSTGPASPSEKVEQPSQPTSTATALQREPLTGVAAASQGRSVAEMAAAAAAAIAASSASVTRGLKPIEPISPLSKVNPKISMPARITDAIREKESAATTVEISKEEPPAVSPTAGDADDLKRIRGIGVLIEKRLNAMTISRYDQIANWTSGDIDRVSRMLEFKGRIERESWVEQARILASGGQTEFSRRVDRGEVDTSRET